MKITIKVNNRIINVFSKLIIKGVPRVLTSSQLSLEVHGLYTFVYSPNEEYTVRVLSYTVRVHLKLIQQLTGFCEFSCRVSFGYT